MSKIFEKYIENKRLFIKICGIKILSHRLDKKKKNNYVVLIKKDGRRVYNPKIEGLNIKFCGNNNIVKLYEPQPKYKNSAIIMYEKNKVEIKNSGREIIGLSIECLYKSKVLIGEDFSIRSGHIISDYNTSVTIGNDCMFSANINIKTTDGHIIYNRDKKEFIAPKNIKVGNHVWMGAGSTLMKGSIIPDNSIVGYSAVVTKPFEEKYSVYAGNPAKLVKSGINWNIGMFWLMKKNKTENDYIEILEK